MQIPSIQTHIFNNIYNLDGKWFQLQILIDESNKNNDGLHQKSDFYF